MMTNNQRRNFPDSLKHDTQGHTLAFCVGSRRLALRTRGWNLLGFACSLHFQKVLLRMAANLRLKHLHQSHNFVP